MTISIVSKMPTSSSKSIFNSFHERAGPSKGLVKEPLCQTFDGLHWA